MKEFKIIKIAAIAVYAMLSVGFKGGKWKYDGKILKDKDGNLYRLEANQVTNESYNLIQLPTADIDSFLKCKVKTNE